ncbi:MAG: HmuY family protein [Prevotella sp.]|nr:HmuY family protein [Bacteroides sp.]MCM1366843.1 HmuY family protein [Prevotella sp.]MCM1437193.1 HmuY family protein [Prevotella sp.]
MRLNPNIMLAGVAAMLLSSCNDVLGSMYDEPENTSEYGFMEVCSATSPGLIYINATDYETWTYIDFASRTTDSLSVQDPAPAKWDFAVHRYDTKTNNAKVVGTSLTDINQARSWTNSDNLPEVADVWTTDKIVADMSTMMDGYLSYVDSYYNPELSKWLIVDTSTMPPIYTPSDKVYILYLENGERAAVKLKDYTNSIGIKGYMSIQYIYPL